MFRIRIFQGEEVLFVEHEHTYEAEGALMFQGFDLETGHTLEISPCSPEGYTLILTHLKEGKEAKEDENDSFVVIGEPEEKPLPEISKPVQALVTEPTPNPVELKATPATLAESVIVEQPVKQDAKKDTTIPQSIGQQLEGMKDLVREQQKAHEDLKREAEAEEAKLREERDHQQRLEAKVREAQRIEEELKQKQAEEFRKAEQAKKAQELLRIEEESKRKAAEAEKHRLELERNYQEDLKRQAEEARRKELAAKEAATAETQADVKPRERQDGATASKVKTEPANTATATVDGPQTLSNIDWNQLLEQAKEV